MAAKKRNDRSSGSNAGTVFWLATIVIVLFLFALNWGKIQSTLARTNFHEIVKTQTGVDKTPGTSTPKVTEPSAPKATEPEPASPSDAAPTASTLKPVLPHLPPIAPPNAGAVEPDTKPKEPSVTAAGNSSKETSTIRVPVPVASPATRNRAAMLYFVRIDDDGNIVRQEVKRQIPVSDSPLLDSLEALLKGPSEDEIRKKLISLVPDGTKLLSAQVRGSTAYLNFNEAFMYNHYGIEGYAGQLKQIVFTATAFPNVQDVQILIEGSRRDYLGGEGVFIGRPLSRNSF
jgi:hypothetical protein